MNNYIRFFLIMVIIVSLSWYAANNWEHRRSIDFGLYAGFAIAVLLRPITEAIKAKNEGRDVNQKSN